MRRYILAISISLLILTSAFTWYKSFPNTHKPTASDNIFSSNDNSQAGSLQVNKTENKIVKIRISAVGDIMVHDGELNAARTSDGDGSYKYDFNPFFSEVKSIIQSADLAIGNLETTISGEDKKYTGYPMFNSPETLLDTLKQTGFDVLTTANNHCLDRKEAGLLNTIDNLDKRELLHTGTFKNEQDRNKILVVNVNDIKIAILAYTYGTNGIPIKNPYQVNLIDINKMIEDVKKAQLENPDLIITVLHFGNEYVMQPNNSQKEIVEKLFDSGVDIILGSHPHVIEPFERRAVAADDGSIKNEFVIYSMGNFISDQKGDYKDIGVITNLYIEKNFKTKKIIISDVEFIPTWVQRITRNGKKSYRILSIPDAIAKYEKKKDDLITQNDYNYLITVYQKIMKHILDGPIFK